jgi:maltose alpha-D-glucosyltransferase/alpha-amylase
VIDYEYHYQTVNVEAQEQNRHSVLWFMRRLIALRRQYKAFGRGTIEILHPENAHVLAFIRSYQDEQILVIANLSRFVQYTELDLSRFKGMIPTELFGRNEFPVITEHPYFITLGPHVFLWFSIAPPRPAAGQSADLPPYQRPRWRMTGSLETMLAGSGRANLERTMAAYLPYARWFQSKARSVKSTSIADSWPMGNGAGGACVALFNTEFTQGDSETYVIPLALATGDKAADLRTRFPDRAIADVDLSSRGHSEDGLIHDATLDPAFCNAMLEAIMRRRRLRTDAAEVVGSATAAMRTIAGPAGEIPEPHVLKAEQSNTSIAFGERMIMKLYRKLEAGVNPELEMTRFLTERGHFPHSPELAGWLEYSQHRAEPRTLAVLHGFVANQGDAWEFTRSELRRYFERAATRSEPPVAPRAPLLDLLGEEGPDPEASHLIGAYLNAARLMGERVAGMHEALCADHDDPSFAPEPCTPLYQRSTYQSMRNHLGHTMRLLQSRLPSLPGEVQPLARKLSGWQPKIEARFEAYLKQRVSVVRIRAHGDLHLGQILHTGKDFAIIDFEGEPARALAERRRKRCALRDVAGMLRSFDYAAHSMMFELVDAGILAERSPEAFQPWADLWREWVSWAFLTGYLAHANGNNLVPQDHDELRVLLEAFVLEKAIYEVGYELNNRPGWIRIPVEGVARIIGTHAGD